MTWKKMEQEAGQIKGVVLTTEAWGLGKFVWVVGSCGNLEEKMYRGMTEKRYKMTLFAYSTRISFH